MDFSKYPIVKRIMDETGASVDAIYFAMKKVEGEGINDRTLP